MSDWRSELKEIEKEKRRWAVLSHLEGSKPARALNPDILLMGCRANGLVTTEAQMQTALEWLTEQHFVTVEQLGNLTIVKITREGREVVQGHTIVKGLMPFGLDV